MQTPKSQLINGNSEIILYLIGGSTKTMMKDNKISFITSLVAEDDITKKETKYRVVKLKKALDMKEFNQYMIEMGYKPIISPNERMVEF